MCFARSRFRIRERDNVRRTSTDNTGVPKAKNRGEALSPRSAAEASRGNVSNDCGFSEKKQTAVSKRRALRVSGSKKLSQKEKNVSGFPITLTSRAFIYPLLVIAALMLAQSLKQPVSYMTFIFVLLLPITVAVQFIGAAISIRTAVRVSSETVQKNDPDLVRVIISNSGPIPFPFIEAVVLRQDRYGVRCVPEYVGVSLPPFSGCEISRNMAFAFRGIYYPGLERIWVYDYFRMVRLRLDVHMLSCMCVVPRRLEFRRKRELYDIDEEADANRPRPVGEDAEPNDLRAYMNGDSLKRIHWKLSSKSQELIVRNYSGNAGKRVYILCDLEKRYENQEDAQVSENIKTLREPRPEYADIIDESLADLVIENALAAAKRELRADSDITLVWLKESDGHPVLQTVAITCFAEYENAFHALAGVSLTAFGKQIEMLIRSLPDADASALIIVTPCVDPVFVECCSAVSRVQLAAGGTTELILCRDDALFVTGDSVRDEEDERLTSLGVSVRLTMGIVSGQETASGGAADS